MAILLKVVHVFASLFLVLVVLLQSGRGGGMGAAFGGASGQIFGGRGAGNFLSRVTTGAAVVFFCTSLTLSMLSSRHRSVVLQANNSAAQDAAAQAADADAGPAADVKAAPKAAGDGDGSPGPRGMAPDAGSAEPNVAEFPTTLMPGALDTLSPAPRGPANAREPRRPSAPEATPPGVPTGTDASN